MAYYGYKPAAQAIQIGDNTIVSADIADGSIVNADLNSSAAIAMSKTQFVAGTGLTLSTNTVNVDAAQTQITSVGTIGTGVWQGTPIASAYVATLNQNTTGTAATVTGGTQASITSAANLVTVGTIGTGVWNAGAVTSSGGISGTTGTFTGTLLADIGAGQNTTKRALEVTEGATANMSMVGYDTVLIQANDAPTIRFYDAGSGQTHSSGTICQDENYMNIATSNELRFSTGLENSEAGYGGGDRQLTISPTSATFAGEVLIHKASGDAILTLDSDAGGDPTINMVTGNNRDCVMDFKDGTTIARFNYDHANTRFEFKAHNTSDVDAYIEEGNTTFTGNVTTAGVSRTMVIDPTLYSKNNVYGTDDNRVGIQADHQTIPLLPGHTITSVLIPTATNRTDFGWDWELCKHDEYSTEVVVSNGTVSGQSGNPWITMDVTDYTIENEQRVYFRISNITTTGGTYGYMYNWRVHYKTPTSM